jgi:hypothetical protein
VVLCARQNTTLRGCAGKWHARDARGSPACQVFGARSLGKMAANAEAVKQQVEEFKSVVPLVQVRGRVAGIARKACTLVLASVSAHGRGHHR